MNAMMFHHCSYSDYDEWETKLGRKGWGYKGIQPFFKKAEKTAEKAGQKAAGPLKGRATQVSRVGRQAQ